MTRLGGGDELGSFYNNPGKYEGSLDQGGSCGDGQLLDTI